VTDWDDTAEAGNVYLPSNVAKGVSLNKTSLDLYPTAEETLTATVTPSDAVDKTVTWRSSDETIATVDENGKVKAVALEGTTTITATSANGDVATCEVNVAIKTLSQLKAAIDLVGFSSVYTGSAKFGSGIANPKYIDYYVDADGNISISDDGNAIGLIKKYGPVDVDTSYVGVQNILVSALNDAGDSPTYLWKINRTKETWVEGKTSGELNSSLDGYGISMMLNDADHPAIHAAVSYNEAKPEGASPWFLPSYNQVIGISPKSFVRTSREQSQNTAYSEYDKRYYTCSPANWGEATLGSIVHYYSFTPSGGIFCQAVYFDSASCRVRSFFAY
jgi:hypothetical protein